jgi:hypothetical protein
MSFLFTLKNPYNIGPRIFEIKPDQKQYAIGCYAGYGPRFGGDIRVYDNCNANNNSYTYGFGNIYNNNTGLDRNTFFTGAQHFTANEIEVFDVTN